MARFTLGRRAGLLLPLSSARGPHGDLASFADAPAIARLLLRAGCTLWQLLPLNEVSPGQDSPYAASSSNALEPVYIDLDQVPEHGGDHALSPEEKVLLESHRAAPRVDFSSVRAVKRAALARAFIKFKSGAAEDRQRDFAAFRERNQHWLRDFALYRALHERRQTSWRSWEAPLRDREPAALERARVELGPAIEELSFIQWLADAQWKKARAECNALGLKVLGDLPFMVAEDSADVWALQNYFRFDATVGVPPDAYSADGQDWGLPVPRWDEMRRDGDPWLTPRAARAAELYDAFRVDHAVGLYRTYARPLAVNGTRGKPFFVPPDEPAQRAQGERILTLLGKSAEVLAEDSRHRARLRARFAHAARPARHQGVAMGGRPRPPARRAPLPDHLALRDRDPRQRGARHLVGVAAGLGAQAAADPARAARPRRRRGAPLHPAHPRRAARAGLRLRVRRAAGADHRRARLARSDEHAGHGGPAELDLAAALEAGRRAGGRD